MSCIHFKDRQARGARLQAELTGIAQRPAETLVQQSWRDFIYAEIWSRPGLDEKARFMIAIAGAASVGHLHAMNAYARGALSTGTYCLAELREVALHVCVYSGWSAGSLLDGAISSVASEMGLEDQESTPLAADDLDSAERMSKGAAEFRNVMTFDGPPVGNGFPYLQDGILNFVFAEMWCRPGLDQRSRRWLTLVGVCDSGADVPIRSHIHAAMASGNCSVEELHEFVLQYGVHAGWPRASRIQSEVFAMSKKIQEGLPFNG